MKRFLWLTIVPCLLSLLAVGCSRIDKEDDGENPYKALSLTTKQSEMVADGNAFSYRFISEVDAFARDHEHTDWFVSPLSLQMALGMLLNGAQGETAAEICTMLGFGAGETAAVNAYCRQLLTQLPALDKKTDLVLANAIFYNKQITLKTSFRNVVSQQYDAALEALDFSKAKATADTINNWCKKQTKGMIPEVLDEEDIDPSMLAYLVNALYFKSQWKEKFAKDDTASEKFTREDNSGTKVKMMKLAGKEFPYGENETYQAIRLPYGNEAFSMTVLLPKEGNTVGDVAARLAKDGRIEILEPAVADLWLPSFETKYHILLNEVLQSMGMNRSFTGQADFLAMSDTPSYVNIVQQDAVIKVDEEGAEAAAVTVIGMKRNASSLSREVTFHADHPFLYLITEASTGVILFAGEYAGN